MRTYIAPALTALALAGCGGNTESTAPDGPTTLSATRYAVASSPSYTSVMQQLYVGFFGRPADPGGLAWYAGMLEGLKAPSDLPALAAAYDHDPQVRALIDTLSNSPEARTLHGDSAAQLIAAVYRQGFNRDADAGGLDFWTRAIATQGLNRAAAVIHILAGAQGSDLATFQRKADAATRFTSAADIPANRALLSGLGSNALVRDKLAVVHSNSSAADIQDMIDESLAALSAQGGYIVRDGYLEVPGGSRKLVLLVAPSQASTLRARLDTLAAVLAADLNGRSGEYGPRWNVVVRESAATVQQVREQLKDVDGAILVGQVPVPTTTDLANGETIPQLAPYILPFCSRYQLPAGAAVTETRPGSDHIWAHSEDRACRNGITVGVLRGTSQAAQHTQLSAKLDQMIAYHRARDISNTSWSPDYRHTEALWHRMDFERDDPIRWWDNIPLYGAGQLSYLREGSGAQRLAAFRACLAADAEMCTFNGHGSRGLVISEGPDPVRDFYSSDAVPFTASELAGSAVNAKFVHLMSCSTQNFLQPDSFGSTILATGKTLLVLGAGAVVITTNDADKGFVQSIYQTLSYGATFAEAMAGKLNASVHILQGDPFISLRPKPAGPQPRLVIDGKHHNRHPALEELAFGDSHQGAKTFRTLSITNPGNADLRLRLAIMPQNVTSTGRGIVVEGESTGGLGFTLEAPAATDISGFGNVGNIVHVVPPGGTLRLQLGFMPYTSSRTSAMVTGSYTGTYEIYSNDPQSPRVVFEMRGNAH